MNKSSHVERVQSQEVVENGNRVTYDCREKKNEKKKMEKVCKCIIARNMRKTFRVLTNGIFLSCLNFESHNLNAQLVRSWVMVVGGSLPRG